MPQSMAIGLLVLGGVLLLIAITGGRFKIFGAEVDSAVSSTPVRLVAGVLGVAFVLTSLAQNKPGGTSSAQSPASDPSQSGASPASGSLNPAPNSTPPSGTASQPASQSIPVVDQSQPARSDSNNSSGAPSTPGLDPTPVTSPNEFAIVFDPPSNVRAAPSAESVIVCSVTAKTSIRILGSAGNWYRTDVCDGRVGYIYRNQVKF